MTKKTFIKHINRIKKLLDSEKYIDEALNLLSDEETLNSFSLNIPIYFMVDVLTDAMNDKYEYISYFIYELDFGKNKMSNECVTEPDGIKISLQTSSQVYNYIIKNNK